MAIIARGFIDQDKLEKAFGKAVKALDPREVRDVHFILGEDYTGDPSIFIRVLLTPEAAQESRLGEVAGRLRMQLSDTLQTYNRWGLLDYFNFTSDPEMYRDPRWAME
jgi:hypothetical protein